MSKAYSNKALPPGTILREWRLEDVLGVGGFGIVYRGRGIYFNELVAIKEYFPSSISERNAEDTVVPIDSDAEEVHALGLKKFVEEAKLLWNLSTPTRHPNIVNVRSLFEIHGTAYMVMDFEDGISLSKLLKQGKKFNERSLRDLVQPIAEGLERAHRVGVLHRDIKPPNILVNEDGRPVLIDFGSARFEAAEATSTKVTFHTPPYAAIEQYVKTYDQGPWTDIYALGVVLYECITGEKPPEVLERMHGTPGKPLSEGKWPGYSKGFLAAIDAAMTIRPTDRPQSIAEWLALFDQPGERSKAVARDADEDATRFVSFDTIGEAIVPVAPPAAGFAAGEAIDTGVPADPSEALFKRAGQETGASRKHGKRGATPKTAPDREQAPAVAAVAAAAGAAASSSSKDDQKASSMEPKRKRTPTPVLVGGAAAVILVLVTAGWALYRPGDDAAVPTASAAGQNAAAPGMPGGEVDAQSLAPAAQALVADARAAGAPPAAVASLDTASEELAGRYDALQAIMGNAADAEMAAGAADEMRRIAASAHAEFASALVRDAEAKAAKVFADVPWANPATPSATARQPANRREAAASLNRALAGLRSGAAAAAEAPNAEASLAAARNALGQWQAFASASSAVYALQAADRPVDEPEQIAPAPQPTTARAPQRTVAPRPAPTVSGAGVSAAKLNQFNAMIDEGRGMARQVIRMGDRGRPRGSAGSEERKAFELRRNNAALARDYDKYLVNLKDSMRGVTTDSEADRLIRQARQTNAYLTFLVKNSSESLR